MRFGFRDNRGSALIEMALTTPIFILMIVGAVELGRIAYFAIEVENAARAGASYGAVNVGNAFLRPNVAQEEALNDAPDIPQMTATATTGCVCETIDNVTGASSFNPSSGTLSCQSAVFTGNNGTACNEATAATTMSTIDYVIVSTQADINSVFNLPGLPSTFTLHGYSAVRILNN